MRRSRAIAPAAVFTAVVVVAILAVAGIYYASSSSNQATDIGTSTTASEGGSPTISISSAPSGNDSGAGPTNIMQIPVSSTSISDSSLGLRLDLNLTGFFNGTLGIRVDDYNLLDKNNNVTAADAWSYPSASLSTYVGACPTVLPFGLAILKGYFDLGSYGSAQALTLNSSVFRGSSCMNPGSPITSYGFLPSSADAWIYTSSGLLTAASVAPLTFLTDGYSTANTPPVSDSLSTFHFFPLGNYTVIAGDEWGQVVLLHFGVVPGPSESQSDTVASSCPGCATGQSTQNSTASETDTGLQLTATIDPATVVEGDNVSITSQVYNSLSTSVVINATSMTDPAEGPCQQGLVMGVQVYQGFDTSTNVSAASQLMLYNPGLTYLCPAIFNFQYTFSPDSDLATVQTTGTGTRTTGPVTQTSIISGYWTGAGQNYTFHSFPAGSYTAVVFDAWGQSVIEHFQVSAG